MNKIKLELKSDNTVENLNFKKQIIINKKQIINFYIKETYQRWSLEDFLFVKFKQYYIELIGFIPIINNEIGLMYFEYLDQKNDSFIKVEITKESYNLLIQNVKLS